MSLTPGSQTDQAYKESVRKNFKFNFIVNVVDNSFFGLATGITSFTTILPLFLANFTDSAILIGLVPSLHSVGWQLPQFFTSNFTRKLQSFKPFVVKAGFHERFPFVLLTLLAFFSQQIPNNLVIIFFFLIFLWHGIATGVTGNPWQNLIARVLPPDTLATFFGAAFGGMNLLGSGGAILAGYILDSLPFPNNFAVCFLLSSFAFAISFAALTANREPPKVKKAAPLDQSSHWMIGKNILRHDKKFVIFLVIRILFQFGMMSLVFFTIFAVQDIAVSKTMVGILTSSMLIAQVISNPLMGWLGDHWGRVRSFLIGSICALLSSGFAYFANQPWMMFPAFIFMGIANSSYWTVGVAYSMLFGTESERPIYIGLANTMVAPFVIIAPIVGGWLAEIGGYRLSFLAAMVFSIIATLTLIITRKIWDFNTEQSMA